jgi:endo-1,4-beta-mannosidase
MYKKTLISDHFIKPNKRDFKWLFAKRLNIKFNNEELLFGENIFTYEEIQNVFILEYKTLFLFKNYILGFEFENKFYQIGINKNNKDYISKYFKINISELKTSIWDILYIILIAILIYLGFKA